MLFLSQASIKSCSRWRVSNIPVHVIYNQLAVYRAVLALREDSTEANDFRGSRCDYITFNYRLNRIGGISRGKGEVA